MKTAFIKKSALAAITAFAMLGASVQSSSALSLCALPCTPGPTVHPTPPHDSGKGEAAAIGAIGGLLLGAAIVGAANKKKKNNALQLHIAHCSGKFQTYDPSTNMYMSFNGPKYCSSPYL